MAAKNLTFGPPADQGIGEEPLLAEIRRRSSLKLEEDIAEARRYRNNAILAEPEKRSEFVRVCHEAEEEARDRHYARLDYAEHEHLGRPRGPQLTQRPAATLRTGSELPPEPTPVDLKEEQLRQARLTRSAKLWLERHLPEIEAAIFEPKATPVNRYQWYGPDGLQTKMLDQLARREAERQGYDLSQI